MSSEVSDLARFSDAVRTACRSQNRYRTLILIGGPRCGKSTLVKTFCQQSMWHHVNYTLDTGFFDAVEDIERYTPGDLAQLVFATMELFSSQDRDNEHRGIVMDEVESILATWRKDIQDLFFSQICSRTRLPCGLVVVTRLRSYNGLFRNLIKNKNQVFNLTGE